MKEVRYSCLAVDYLDEINDQNGKNLDDIKEKLVEKFKPKAYLKREIDYISASIGFDLWKGMVWCDYERWHEEGWSTSIGLRYRLIGFEDIFGEKEQRQVLQHLNYENFYSQIDIQKIESFLGYDFFYYCKWETFSEITRDCCNDNLHYHYFRKLSISK